MTVTGTLTNSGTIAVGSPFDAMTAANTITAAHLVNTGSIALYGQPGATVTL